MRIISILTFVLFFSLFSVYAEDGLSLIHISIDETKLDENHYNWGYDPANYNVPDGSYSTEPYQPDHRKVVKVGVNFDSATRSIGDWKIVEEV